MNNTDIPGPAGEDDIFSATNQPLAVVEVDGHLATASAAGSKESLCHILKTCQAQNVTVEVLKITPSINGEASLLLRDAVGVIRASLTREATTKHLGTIQVGDVLALNKVHIIASGHYQPVRLICIDAASMSSKNGSPQQGEEDMPQKMAGLHNDDLYQFTDSDQPSPPKSLHNALMTHSEDVQTGPPLEDEIDALFDGLEDPF